MKGLETPQLEKTTHSGSITPIFLEVCNCLTVLSIYAILWMLILVAGYKLYQVVT